jgi:hypothetical protein
MSNLYRGPSIDLSYQVSVHLSKQFQRRRFLEMYQSETRIACGGDVYSQIGTKWLIGQFLKKCLPLKPFDQININLVGSIYGRSSIKMLISQTWPPQESLVSDWLISKKISDGKSSHRLWQVELKRQVTF